MLTLRAQVTRTRETLTLTLLLALTLTRRVPGLASSHAAWRRAMERPDRLTLPLP